MLSGVIGDLSCSQGPLDSYPDFRGHWRVILLSGAIGVVLLSEARGALLSGYSPHIVAAPMPPRG